MKNIIEKAIKGDRKSFEKLYEISKKQVYFTCLGIVKNKSDAEDITQEVYITVLKKLSELSAPESFQAWINRIAVTKSLKFVRKSREASLDEELEKNGIADEELILPDDYISNKEKRQIIMNIIMNKLSDVQRQTVILYYFDNFKVAEISKAMECPVGTVTYRLSSARKLIKSEVLSYEKKNNDKLHALVPFSLEIFLKKQSETIDIPIVKIKIPKHSRISVKSASKAVFATAIPKTALALTIPVIAVGGITAVKLSEKNNTVPSAVEYTETIAENIKNTDTIITTEETTETSTTAKSTDTTTTLITTATITSISTSTSTSITTTITEEMITEAYTEAPEIYYTQTESFTETSEPEIYYSEVSETEIPMETTVTTTETTVLYDDILEKAESYQEKFFEYLEIRETPDYNNLSTEEKYQLVNSIYAEVESLIPQDNEYYQRYINVIPELEANHYGYIDVPDDYYYNPTTVHDMQGRAFEELLNSEYEFIKNQIPEENFIKLEESQAKWKEDKENFINILPVIASPHVEAATAEMNKFRCLVLMLYLE